MTSCITLFGLPGNGKTYASKILAKQLDVKLIPFDEIINILSEYVRKKLEKLIQLLILMENLFLKFLSQMKIFKNSNLIWIN